MSTEALLRAWRAVTRNMWLIIREYWQHVKCLDKEPADKELKTPEIFLNKSYHLTYWGSSLVCENISSLVVLLSQLFHRPIKQVVTTCWIFSNGLHSVVSLQQSNEGLQLLFQPLGRKTIKGKTTQSRGSNHFTIDRILLFEVNTKKLCTFIYIRN